MQNISVEELKQRMEAGEELNLIDVREISENTEFNIGGILIPLEKFRLCKLKKLKS